MLKQFVTIFNFLFKVHYLNFGLINFQAIVTITNSAQLPKEPRKYQNIFIFCLNE